LSQVSDVIPPPKNRLVAFTSFVGAICCVLTAYFIIQAGAFDYETAGDPAGQLQVGLEGASMMKWMMITDMFGFYLPTIPTALYVWFWLGNSRMKFLVGLASVCAVCYALIGSIGASILSVMWPGLVTTYTTATDPAVKASSVEFFTFVTTVVQDGMWGRLEFFFSSVWYIGLGIAVWRHAKGFAIWTLATGACAAIISFGKFAESGDIAGPGLYGILVTIPVWFLWIAALSWSDVTRSASGLGVPEQA
jgi:hypothetical protein